MSTDLKRKIANIKRKISRVQQIHPGKITKQFNVCGKAGCRCKDKKNPQKHGPYFYLSYTFKGKGKTVFVPKSRVKEIETYTKNHQKMKKLFEELIELNIELAKEEVFKHEARTEET